jgi:hypothetical protein
MEGLLQQADGDTPGGDGWSFAVERLRKHRANTCGIDSIHWPETHATWKVTLHVWRAYEPTMHRIPASITRSRPQT